MTDARSPLRALRAAAFAAVCVTVAALGHSYTSGGEIPAASLWAAFGMTGIAAWSAGRRPRGTWSIGAGMLTVQGALHVLFSGVLPFVPPYGPYGGTNGSTPEHGPHADAFMGAGAGMGTVGGAEAVGGAASGAMPVLGGSPGTTGMVAAHLLAAVVCAWWLARGEAALLALARAAGALAFAPLRLLFTAVRPAVAFPSPRPGRGTVGAAHHIRGVVLAHALSRRGPPACRTPRATAPEAAAVTAV
ncbi:hypothetical protein [Streptomyces sp. NRRL F-5135]|uniref:hypothetical protein n=1 Tax=Streptomyces sp. NRRL F-5135 TaxID=1463858 RepID=UPI0004CAC739|nr:hypothetical protein [Streptomyces sp. NRRL F-5135]